MNKDIVIIIPIEMSISDSFRVFLSDLNGAFSRILIIDENNYFTNNILPFDKNNNVHIIHREYAEGSTIREGYLYSLEHFKNAKSFVILDQMKNYNLEDIIKCSNISLNTQKCLILGVKDLDLMPLKSRLSSKVLRSIVNLSFNRCFKDVIADIKVFDNNAMKSFLDAPENKIETPVSILLWSLKKNILIKEVYITTACGKKYNDRYGLKENWQMVKELLPFLIKTFLPYVISLLLFFICFDILNSNNDLQAIIFSNIITGLVGVLIHLLINYQVYYKTNHIINNFISLLKKNLKIIIASFLIYICYNLLDLNLFMSKIIVDFFITVIMYYIFRNVGFKNEKEN